jgi:hypothetical protein
MFLCPLPGDPSVEPSSTITISFFTAGSSNITERKIQGNVGSSLYAGMTMERVRGASSTLVRRLVPARRSWPDRLRRSDANKYGWTSSCPSLVDTKVVRNLVPTSPRHRHQSGYPSGAGERVVDLLELRESDGKEVPFVVTFFQALRPVGPNQASPPGARDGFGGRHLNRPKFLHHADDELHVACVGHPHRQDYSYSPQSLRGPYS